MKQPPSDRDRAIASAHEKGRTLSAVGKDFGITAQQVWHIAKRVGNYDRGIAMLRADPTSIEAIVLMGELKPAVRNTLVARRIERITDLEGIPTVELLRWRGIGPQAAAELHKLLEDYKRR